MRRQLTEDWSIELDEEYASRVVDGNLQLAAPSRPRTIRIAVWSPPETEEPKALLEWTKQEARPDPEWFTEEQGAGTDELRYASWYAESGERGTQYSLYGYTVRRGSVVQGAFISDAPDDREWALETWRSLRHQG